MQTKTFENLPDKKKKMIIDIAIDEFSEHGYKNATINNIVKRANIAKGSIYQYFESKEDLFMYILELSISKKLKYMKQVQLNLAGLSFFDQIRELCVLDIKFSRDNPKLEKIFIKVLLSGEILLKTEIMEKISFASENLIKALLKEGIQKREFREEIDIDLSVFAINSLFINLSNKILQDFNGDVSDEQIMFMADKLLDLLKNGLSN
ncbi:MAG: TetR/AcrR family transcriptional regulator [Halanaerobiales bacterium]|nr:TetR/AcrR family transcriptional regulator [Halanaerobiales bacterium]